MKLELWRLFREDVRDLFELTTSNMNTYMVVGSLLVTCIIGFIFVGYSEFPMEPPWLLLIWNNSVFSSITFGITSVWLATHGSSSSNSAATKILTQADHLSSQYPFSYTDLVPCTEFENLTLSAMLNPRPCTSRSDPRQVRIQNHILKQQGFELNFGWRVQEL
ncbi:unnamed protein product [Symbiodinium sp. KB8]|nr:unnamed protein product [Symbiodinium sp. KB8]